MLLPGGKTVFSGAYALAGAAAMLGGVQRASISLVFIMVEGTANVHFLLPIVTSTLTAGDLRYRPTDCLVLTLRMPRPMRCALAS